MTRFAVKAIPFLASGVVLSQILNIILLPVLLRFFSPEEYGAFVSFTAWATLLIPLATLSLPLAIAVAQHPRVRYQLAELIFYNACLIAVLLSLFMLFSNSLGLLWLPLALTGAAAWQAQYQLLISQNRFQRIAKVELAVLLFLSGAKLLMAWYYPHASGLILLFSLGFWLSALSSGWRPHWPRHRRLLSLLRQHREFVWYQMPQQWLNAASLSLPVLSLAFFYSNSAAAQYALASAVLLMPATLIAKSVGDLYLSGFATQIGQKQPVLPLLKKYLVVMLPLSFLMCLVVVIFGPDLFALIFGADWAQAAYFSQLLVLWAALVMLNPPFVRLFIAFKRQKVAFLLNLLSLLVRIAMVAIAVLMKLSADELVMLVVLPAILHNVLIISLGWYYAAQHAKMEL